MLQFCRSRKVRSSKHSGVEYTYSKCTPTSSAREYQEKYADEDRNELENLISYLDHEKTTVDTADKTGSQSDEQLYTADGSSQEFAVVESDFQGTAENTVESDFQGTADNVDERDRETVETTDNEADEPVERADDEPEPVDTTGNDSEDLMEDSTDFQGSPDQRSDDQLDQEEVEKVDDDHFHESTADREFVEGMDVEERLDADDPIIVA